MSEPLVFMMGEFKAELPVDRHYASNHMWALVGDESIRFGFTSYAVRLLQDVYFLDWDVEAPVDLKDRQEIGQIESKKAESSLYAPIAGKLTQLNQQLLSDPSGINVDKYENGWLFEMVADQDEKSKLLSPDQYVELLVSVWDKTQKAIKGQLNG